MQADQYTGLFEDITKRYDTDLGTLEKEYNLWTAQNSNTASKLDKIDRETEYQKNELELKQKKEAKAKEQWETLRKEYGESDLRTKEAWNDYLDAQTESLQLQNDIAKQSLNKLDAQLSIIKDEQSRMQSRMDLLTSIYGDGSLKDREDAYKQAVEQYGENSAEARKSKVSGYYYQHPRHSGSTAEHECRAGKDPTHPAAAGGRQRPEWQSAEQRRCERPEGPAALLPQFYGELCRGTGRCHGP